MNRQQLVAAANELPPVPEAAAETYAAAGPALAAAVTARLGERDDLDRLIGSGNAAMMADNHRNHARYMSAVFAGVGAEDYVDTILWVFGAYRCHGFHTTYWAAQINAWIDAVDAQLPAEHAAAIRPWYAWLQRHIPDFTALSDPAVTG